MDISLYQKEVLKLNDKLHHHLSHLLRVDFDRYHITDMQFQALNYIAYHDGTTIGDMAKALGVDAGNMSSLCKKLEHYEYALRLRGSEDERVVHLHLTRSGKRCVSDINDKLKEHYDSQWQLINDKDKELILNGLIKLNQFFESFQRKDDKK